MNLKNVTLAVLMIAAIFSLTKGMIYFFSHFPKEVKKSGFWLAGFRIGFSWQFQKFILLTVVFILLTYFFVE